MMRFDLRDTRASGDLVKENRHTVWVKLSNGDVIKRHKKKHNVVK
jgi:hypothetical protein